MDAQTVDYQVIVHHEDDSYWAEVRELPGCFAAGETMDELWESLTEAISLYISTPESELKAEIAGREVVSSSESVEARVLVC